MMHKYAPHMRTTLILNDELATAAKRLAADRRTSLSQLVNDALRRELESPARTHAPLAIPVFGGTGGDHPDTSPAELDALGHDTFEPAR